jgi:uncharacterized protein YecT (DUF1311 family)
MKFGTTIIVLIMAMNAIAQSTDKTPWEKERQKCLCEEQFISVYWDTQCAMRAYKVADSVLQRMYDLKITEMKEELAYAETGQHLIVDDIAIQHRSLLKSRDAFEAFRKAQVELSGANLTYGTARPMYELNRAIELTVRHIEELNNLELLKISDE